VLPDDDKQYAIETCRSSESVLKKKLFKNKLRTISAFVGFVIIIGPHLKFHTPAKVETRRSFETSAHILHSCYRAS